MRLNVYLQKAGVGSRREAERLVEQGLVTVNGARADVTTPVEEGDAVAINGKPVAPATRSLPRLFLLHKPVDYLVTHRDPEGRQTIWDLPCLKPPLWSRKMPRLMSVGRLDVNSEGLLVLSSDGALAQLMMSPDTGLERVYRVRVRGKLTPAQIAAVAEGVTIDDVRYRGAEVAEEPDHDSRTNTWYRVVLTEGKKREIRRLFRYFDCPVNRLIRVSYGPFKLGDLQQAELREVPAREVRALMDRVGIS